MNSEIQPIPDPAAPVAAGESSHAPAVLRNSALQIGGHVGAIALTAASTIVLTRFLGVDGYGRFTVLTVFLLIGASLSEFGLNGTAIRWMITLYWAIRSFLSKSPNGESNVTSGIRMERILLSFSVCPTSISSTGRWSIP